MRVRDLGVPWYSGQRPAYYPETPLDALVARGLAGVDEVQQLAFVWLDVAVALNGGRLFTAWPEATQPTPRPLERQAVAVPAVVAQLDRLLRVLGGGAGARAAGRGPGRAARAGGRSGAGTARRGRRPAGRSGDRPRAARHGEPGHGRPRPPAPRDPLVVPDPGRAGLGVGAGRGALVASRRRLAGLRPGRRARGPPGALRPRGAGSRARGRRAPSSSRCWSTWTRATGWRWPSWSTWPRSAGRDCWRVASPASPPRPGRWVWSRPAGRSGSPTWRGASCTAGLRPREPRCRPPAGSSSCRPITRSSRRRTSTRRWSRRWSATRSWSRTRAPASTGSPSGASARPWSTATTARRSRRSSTSTRAHRSPRTSPTWSPTAPAATGACAPGRAVRTCAARTPDC